ncbi:hypothetical protein [Haloferula sp. BvORR071]|uniref:hypothetical protein n=1 Tax=Haloferula sp. BvORR071 TaxID=1396141 RepID=UPI00055633A6|nr:hypothetical protein [Haloferula sp. BvORR071]
MGAQESGCGHGTASANPDLIASDRSYELAKLVKTSGRGDELMGLAQQMPEEQAASLKRALQIVGAAPPEPDAQPSHQQVLTLMWQNPEKAEAQWQSFSEEQRGQMIELMNSDSGFPVDPAFVLKRLVEAKADLGKEGGRRALGRLSLSDPRAAARLVEDMPPGESRDKMIKALRENWAVDDEAAATEWGERVAPKS